MFAIGTISHGTLRQQDLLRSFSEAYQQHCASEEWFKSDLKKIANRFADFLDGTMKYLKRYLIKSPPSWTIWKMVLTILPATTIVISVLPKAMALIMASGHCQKLKPMSKPEPTMTESLAGEKSPARSPAENTGFSVSS